MHPKPEAQKIRARLELMSKRNKAVTEKGVVWLCHALQCAVEALDEIQSGAEDNWCAEKAIRALESMVEVPNGIASD